MPENAVVFRGGQERVQRFQGGHTQDATDQPRKHGEGQRLDHDLDHDVGRGGAKRPTHTQFAGALFDGDEHDVHDADDACKQRKPPKHKRHPPKRAEHRGHFLMHLRHAPVSETAWVVGVHTFLGFEKAQHFRHSSVARDVFSDEQAQPPHPVAHVKRMVERGVRREDAVLALLRVFTCLLASVHAHDGERHALNLDVAPQDLLLSVKQELPHAFANHGHLAAVLQVTFVDVAPLHDDNRVDVLVHGHVAVDPACSRLQSMGDVVAAPPASELIPRRHGLQRGRVFFQERHVHGGQFNATPPGIPLVREAGRLAPQERAVLDAVAHVGFDAFLQAVGRPHCDEDHEESPTHTE